MMELRFLLDEDVSPTHAKRLNELGHYAVHVAHVGLAGQSDEKHLAYAIDNTLISSRRTSTTSSTSPPRRSYSQA
jgi:predicted nuclease of predicted toxin-antitoxin system